MDQRQIVVETGLDERAGGSWSTARWCSERGMPDRGSWRRWWRRSCRTWRAVSARSRARVGPRGLASGMPEPILEPQQDYAPSDGAAATAHNAQLDHASRCSQIVLKLWPGDEDAPGIVWCIANRLDYSDAAE
jgi:hypothetical protein